MDDPNNKVERMKNDVNMSQFYWSVSAYVYLPQNFWIINILIETQS